MGKGVHLASGELRNSLKIQKPDNPRDAHGGQATDSWKTIGKACTKIRPLSGTERIEHAKMKSIVTHEITLRYQTGIDTTMRFLFGDRPLNIVSIINIEERNRVLVAMCKEVVK